MAKGLAPIFFTACGVVVAGVAGYAVFESQSSATNPQKTVSEITASSGTVVQPKPAETEEEVAKLDTLIDDVSNDAALEQEAKLDDLEIKSEASETKPKEPETNTAALETKVDEPEPKVEAKVEEPDAKTDAPIAPIVVEPVKPSFGLVRVERDGSAVIAGDGPANELVELIEGSKVLAKTKISSAGEFVFVLDEPLAPGPHELFLRVIPNDGSPSLSSSFAFVDVPKPKTIGEVTVLLAEVGKPTQILQKPKATSDDDGPKSEDKTVTATAQSKITLAKPEEVSEVDDAKAESNEEVASVQVEPKKAEVSSLAPVLIEAADVEKGKIFIAGTGEPLTTINIYLENDLLGSTQVAENGAFLFEGSTELKPGRHNIRADMTKGGASVLARAEVTLVHEPKVVANIPKEEPIKEVASVEPQVETVVEEQPVSASEEVELEEEAAPVIEETKTKDEVEPKLKTEVEEAVSVEASDILETDVAAEQDKKEIQTGSAVIIRRGDNLWTVARRNYGAGIRYTTIFDANRDQVRDPHVIYPGQVLKIPESEQATQ